jgi:hypothetical protein
MEVQANLKVIIQPHKCASGRLGAEITFITGAELRRTDSSDPVISILGAVMDASGLEVAENMITAAQNVGGLSKKRQAISVTQYWVCCKCCNPEETDSKKKIYDAGWSRRLQRHEVVKEYVQGRSKLDIYDKDGSTPAKPMCETKVPARKQFVVPTRQYHEGMAVGDKYHDFKVVPHNSVRKGKSW